MQPEPRDRAEDLAQIEIVVFMQAVDLFRFCRAEELLRLARISRQRRYGAGETVYSAGDRPDGIYCVVRGGVTLTRESEPDRQIAPLYTFGVRGVLTGRMRVESARAEKESLVLFFDAEDFFDLLAHNIDIVRALFRQLLNASHDDEGAS
jgi:CRP-like cAMP-binding protein